MNNSTKEQIGCDVICKSHSARTERELYRICPSKISKRELEDLYFALLENNLELKKSINIYQDKVKVLSTKLQRMTVQKNVAGKEKDCCASKAVVSEQKESITDLKKANERMADRIRILNMRLCSAKQFLKRSPSQSTSCKTCTRCSFKNSSMSALNPNKKSDSMTRTTAASCQSLVKDVSEKATGTAETVDNSNIPENATEESCNENKCRTNMDELKEKINNLQEELSTSHDEYSQRIAKLEAVVAELREENVTVRSERAASEHALQQRASRAAQLQDRLRSADAKCNELNMELSIEKRKVAELETGLKLANLSNHVMETIDQLAATKDNQDEKEQAAEATEQEPQTQTELSRDFSRFFYNHNNDKPDLYKDDNIDLNVIEISRESSRSQKNEEMDSSSKILELPTPRKSTDVKTSRSDDSGYTELNKSCEAYDDQALVKINRELLKKIADLQTQLDLVKITTAGNLVESECQHREPRNPREFESYDNETDDINDPRSVRLMEDLNTMLLRDKPPDGATVENYQTTPKLSDELNPSSVPQTESTASKPWEDLLVQNESVEDNIQDDVQSQCNSTKVKFDTKAPRNDDHNSYQIPGPIPAVYPSQNAKDKRRNLRNSQSKESVDRPKKKTSAEEKTVKIFENNVKENASTIDKDETCNESEHKDFETPNRNERSRRRSIEARLANRTPTRDSIFVTKKKLTLDGGMAEVKKESETSYYFDSVCTPPISDRPVTDLMKETATQVDEKAENANSPVLPTPELCEAHATICRCPSRRRDVSVFRSCSGTLRFRTSVTQGFRRCACLDLDDGTQIEPGPRRDSATYTAEVAHTYSVPERQSRATSPGNTEQEISSLSDLPSEKDGNTPDKPRMLSPGESPRAAPSPGEAGAGRTTTCTEAETETHDYGSLSEGEMPAVKGQNLSIGEWRSYLTNPPATSSDRMEATLASIGEELARCRRLLLSQRAQENGPGHRAEPSADEVGIELRHSAANRHIVESDSLSCLFILHIGTLVLSDESMVYFRDKTLALTWRFYTQNAAMTRVQAARVVRFDFVTEYDVAFNDHFLDYMKHSSMAIVLCEMNKQEQPFAMCSLPLREALLHANRRADMSLALLPVNSEGKRNSIGDEIGILDLWCTLRVDVSLMPTIYRVMHMSSPPNLVYPSPMLESRSSNVIQQAVDDEVSSERLSRDLDLSLKSKNSSGKQLTSPELFSEKFKPKGSEIDIQSSTTEHASSRYDEEVQGYQVKRPYRRRSTQTQKSTPSSDLGRRGVVNFQNRWPHEQLRQESSGIIINEVPTTIRSKEDMKLALEKNSAVRQQISKLRLIKNKQQTSDRVYSLEELLKKKPSSLEESTRMPMNATEVSDKEQDSKRAKMINISKHVATTPEMNKMADTSKKCVKYNDMLSCDEPDKEDSADGADSSTQSIDITVLWLALNEECEAMVSSSVQRLYVAYSFLGRRGADLETPFSLPKPKHYADKCYFNFKKTFHIHECDLPLLGHMSRCRASGGSRDPRDCIVFTVVSEPAEDPLGLSNCEDIGYAYLYLGDVVAASGGRAGYTEVVGVRGVRGGVCGVLAVRLAPLPVLRRALALTAP